MTQIAHRFSREPSTTGAELTDSARAEIEQIVTELTEHMRMTRPMTRGERSREWLALFFETAKAADVLAETDFVPPSMKGKPKQVATAIMKGYELDIDPLDALANIYIVHGRVGFSAEFMRRRIIQAGHEIRVTEASDSRAVLEGCRRGAEEWQRAVFTAAQAHKAKIDLAGYPEDKLIARATSRLCKRAFPDVLSGAAIVEDLADDYAAGATAAGAVTEAPPIKRRRKPAPKDTAPAVEADPVTEQSPPEPEPPPLPDEDTGDDGDEATAGPPAAHLSMNDNEGNATDEPAP